MLQSLLRGPPQRYTFLGHPHFVMAKVTEVSRADLVGQHLGETAMQVTKVFEPLGPCLGSSTESQAICDTAILRLPWAAVRELNLSYYII